MNFEISLWGRIIIELLFPVIEGLAVAFYFYKRISNQKFQLIQNLLLFGLLTISFILETRFRTFIALTGGIISIIVIGLTYRKSFSKEDGLSMLMLVVLLVSLFYFEKAGMQHAELARRNHLPLKTYYSTGISLFLNQVFILFLFFFHNVTEHRYSLIASDMFFLCMNGLIFLTTHMVLEKMLSVTTQTDLDIFRLLFISLSVLSALTIPFYVLLTKSLTKIEVDERLLQLKESKSENALKETNFSRSVMQMRHDFKHHMEMVSEYVAENRIEDLEQYISKVDKEVAPMVLTECEDVDALITMKHYLLTKKKITFLYSLCNLYQKPINDTEMVSLLINLLDNAEEAQEGVPMDARYIRLNISHVEEMLVIFCENPYTKKISDPTYGHGLGLKIIQDIADKYQGIVTIRKKDLLYSIVISIPWEKDRI